MASLKNQAHDGNRQDSHSDFSKIAISTPNGFMRIPRSAYPFIRPICFECSHLKIRYVVLIKYLKGLSMDEHSGHTGFPKIAILTFNWFMRILRSAYPFTRPICFACSLIEIRFVVQIKFGKYYVFRISMDEHSKKCLSIYEADLLFMHQIKDMVWGAIEYGKHHVFRLSMDEYSSHSGLPKITILTCLHAPKQTYGMWR